MNEGKTSSSGQTNSGQQNTPWASMDPLSAIAVPIQESTEQLDSTASRTVRGGPTDSTRSAADPPAARAHADPRAASESDEEANCRNDDHAEVSDGDKKDEEEGATITLVTTSEPPRKEHNRVSHSGIDRTPTNKCKWALIASLASLAVIGLATVGGVCGSGRCRSTGTIRTDPQPIDIFPTVPPESESGEQGKTSPPSSSTVQTPAASPPLTKLEQIVARGLSCGVMDLPGQSEVSATGERVGFSVDLCRAISAALFGSSAGDRLNIVPVQATDRFMLLDDGDVDVLAASVTHTMERDLFEPTTQVGYSFSTPYLYNGMGFAGVPPFGGCADRLNITDCLQAPGDAPVNVCVLDGTTYVSRVTELLPGVALSVVPTTEAFYENFRRGLCNVLAGDQFEISASAVQQRGYFGPYETGENLYTKEPLALVTTEADATWSDFVNWVVQGLLAAEEQSFTQDRFSFFKRDGSFGQQFESMFQDALGEVGNYAEMYERNLGELVPRSDANMINPGTTGLVYAMPFGSLSATGPTPLVGSTIREIVDRGFLRCGITRRAIFAEFNSATQEWQGLDIDFCKALSAALFDGVTRSIVYSVLPATERFLALAEGQVDVLSRITTITLARDAREPSANVGFSFSQPNFYDGLSFGGIPPFGACADNRDISSAACQGLQICYNEGTTFESVLKALFPDRILVARQSGDLVAEGLEVGACNAVAGGVVDVSTSNIRNIGGYSGPYETGSGRFSKDPLALVTRQDDPQWSAFVYWVVSAIFYAEEEGITAASSMPIVNLFGPFNSRIFRDAIDAVGSYKDIYGRHAGSEVERGGLNSLNTNPLTAQHYPLPGL